ncbi:DUF2507 domain-containing protein [Bacillaceae bacterium SIJ1]|nr:DUF2507 domain-containing protein [Litoribacterium kuwaitense]
MDEQSKSKHDAAEQPDTNETVASPFSIRLLRHTLLPDILGKQQKPILYYAGKSLARKFPLQSLDECPVFFHKAEWGKLRLIRQKKAHLVFELTNPVLLEKNDASASDLFALEAGFIAETIANIFEAEAEGTISEASKKGSLRLLLNGMHKSICVVFFPLLMQMIIYIFRNGLGDASCNELLNRCFFYFFDAAKML